MPRPNDKFDSPLDIKVFIRDAQGKYLSEDNYGLYFASDRDDAIILSYRADQVEAQLETIRRAHGIALVPDPVPAEEIYETCDRCKELFPPLMTFFDGKTFLCPDCRQQRSPLRTVR